MNAVQRQRMRQLIAFLRTLRPEQFDLSLVRRENPCGTVGCAIGWTPEVFPELVKFDNESRDFIWLPTGTGHGYDGIGCGLFGLTYTGARDLFSPELQQEISPQLPKMPPFAHAHEVAAMLERFLELVDAGELAHLGLWPVSDALAVESGVVA